MSWPGEEEADSVVEVAAGVTWDQEEEAGAVTGEGVEASLLAREAEQVELALSLEAVEAEAADTQEAVEADAGNLETAAATFLGTFVVAERYTVVAAATLAVVGNVAVASERLAVVAAKAWAFPDLVDQDPSSG